MSAAYYRAYRLAHPEKRAQYNETRKKYRALHGRDRTGEYRRRTEREAARRADTGVLLESNVVRKDHGIVSQKLRPDRRATLWDDRYEDLVGEVVVALCEDSDPVVAMTKWKRWYWDYHYKIAPLDGVIAREDGDGPSLPS